VRPETGRKVQRQVKARNKLPRDAMSATFLTT
jgi:hypothetical protein